MSKRTVATNITPLPAGITRETVVETLHDHLEMIDLNPLVIKRFQCKPPNFAGAEEYHCIWYQLTDKVQYLPGGLAKGNVTYHACFHDLANGLQTHVYAPLGLDIKEKWTVGGNLPGEPREPVELGLGAPKEGLYLREDIDMRSNFMTTGFVKRTLKKAHEKLVARMIERAHIVENKNYNSKLRRSSGSTYSASVSDGGYGNRPVSDAGCWAGRPFSDGSMAPPSLSRGSDDDTVSTASGPTASWGGSPNMAYQHQSFDGKAMAGAYHQSFDGKAMAGAYPQSFDSKAAMAARHQSFDGRAAMLSPTWSNYDQGCQGANPYRRSHQSIDPWSQVYHPSIAELQGQEENKGPRVTNPDTYAHDKGFGDGRPAELEG